MSERKYRQHGYQDDDRDRSRQADRDRRPAPTPGAPAATRRLSSEGARNPNLMGYHEVVKCARCGAPVDPAILSLSTCAKCDQALHACVQCAFYAPGAYNDCREPQADRVTDKEKANFCDWFEPGSGASGPDPKAEARARLDALFPKK